MRWMLVLLMAAGGAVACDDGGGTDDGADMMMGGEGGEGGAGGEGGGGDDSVPAEFRDLTNPLAGDADAEAAGQTLYTGTCDVCHQADGTGGLFDPPSTDFTIDQSAWSDGYLFWRISAGPDGGPDGTTMPAYDGQYDENQIWQLVTYIRSFGS